MVFQREENNTTRDGGHICDQHVEIGRSQVQGQSCVRQQVQDQSGVVSESLFLNTSLRMERKSGGRGRRISEFVASLVYGVSSRTVRATRETLS